MINFDPKKMVLTAFREEVAASTDPMDRWGVVNRAWKRIDDYMRECQSSNVIQEYDLFWDGVDLFRVTYTDSFGSLVVKVNLGEI